MSLRASDVMVAVHCCSAYSCHLQITPMQMGSGPNGNCWNKNRVNIPVVYLLSPNKNSSITANSVIIIMLGNGIKVIITAGPAKIRVSWLEGEKWIYSMYITSLWPSLRGVFGPLCLSPPAVKEEVLKTSYTRPH